MALQQVLDQIGGVKTQLRKVVGGVQCAFTDAHVPAEEVPAEPLGADQQLAFPMQGSSALRGAKIQKIGKTSGPLYIRSMVALW